jgi:hypothetical protein
MGKIELTDDMKACLLASVDKGEFDTNEYPEFKDGYEGGPSMRRFVLP